MLATWKHFKAVRLCEKGSIKMFSQARVFVWLIIATFGCLSQFGSTPVVGEEACRADAQLIDAKTCGETLPYIQMSKDVYSDEAGLKFRRVGGDWTIGKQYLRRPAAQI